MKTRFCILIVICCIYCATTSISTIRNKEVAPVTFTRIMVFAPFKDIGIRKMAEASFVTKMYRKDLYTREETKKEPPKNPYYETYAEYVEKKYIETHLETLECGIRSIDVIPPFREYSPEDLQARYAASNIDGILVVALEDFWTADLQVYQYHSYTNSMVGYTVSSPRLRFDIRLVDVASGTVVWMATAVTSGNALVDDSTLLGSLAESIVEELFREDFLIKKVEHSTE